MERLPGDPRAWSNSTMMPSMMPLPDSVVACAEGHALTHESEECSRRKQRGDNIANRTYQWSAKYHQAKGDKPVSEELDSQTKSDSKSVTQNWQCPLLWAALGGKPDTDFVEGIAIVSHLNGPELALAQALQHRRMAQATPSSYATTDAAEVIKLREQSRLKVSDLCQPREADQVSDLDDYIFPVVMSQFEADFTGDWLFELKKCWTDPSLLPVQKELQYGSIADSGSVFYSGSGTGTGNGRSPSDWVGDLNSSNPTHDWGSTVAPSTYI